ncbi:unnamed protein product [Effrenium voratum]|uniref:Palmitoyltransferase n=1 Tax=Effrenium voratum TaxID=2562239 RepID=A0AA36NLY5_9DINO|nr:unnamed protein product [Effrenium voratum]
MHASKRKQGPDRLWTRKTPSALQVWPSKTFFCCWGRCVTAYPSGPTFCAWTFILVPCGFYCMFIERLWNEWYPLVPVAACCIFLLTTMLLCLTCCSDPGAIPRRKVIISAGLAEELSELLGYSVLGRGEPTGQAEVDGTAMVPDELRKRGFKWCRTCQIVRPPRCSHCPDCDQCVLRYDHHCPFVNNCIGQRNYHFFVGFVTSVVCLALAVLPGLLWCILTPSTTTEDASPMNDALKVVIIVVASLAGIVLIALLVFLGYHAFLIASGMTTKEHLGKSRAQIAEEPTLFAARGPRLYDPRQFILV